MKKRSKGIEMRGHRACMRVSEVITALRKLPSDLPVYHQDTVHPHEPASPLHTVAMVPSDGEDDPNWVLLL